MGWAPGFPALLKPEEVSYIGLYIGSYIRFHLIKKVLNLKIIALGEHTEASDNATVNITLLLGSCLTTVLLPCLQGQAISHCW